METLLDIGAVIIFFLVVPSVAWAVRNEYKEASGTLAIFVGMFAAIFGLVSLSAASQLAASVSSTQIVLLIFFMIIAIFARGVWSSKRIH